MSDEYYPGQYQRYRERVMKLMRRNTPYTVQVEKNGFIYINRPDIRAALPYTVPAYIP